MRPFAPALALALLLSGCVAPLPPAETARPDAPAPGAPVPALAELMNRHVRALGGAEATMALGGRLIHGTIREGKRVGSFRVAVMVDGRYRSTTIFGDDYELVGFDGARPWAIDAAGRPLPLEGAAADRVLLRAARASLRYTDPQWRPLQIHAAEPESLDGLPHDVVVVRAPAGTEMRLILDRAEGLVRASTIAGFPPRRHEDYRIFAHVALAHRHDLVAAGGAQARTLVVDEIEPLPEADPALFAFPSRPLNRPYRLEGGDRSGPIAIAVREERVLVPVSIEGGPPLPFALDLGSAESCIDGATADRLGIMAAGTGTRCALRPDSLGIGGATLLGPVLALHDLARASAPDRSPLAGLLGRDLLARLVVELDLVRGRMQLRDPATYRYPGPGAELALALPEAGARIVALVEGRHPGRLLVDLGRAESFFWGDELLRRLGGSAADRSLLLEKLSLNGRVLRGVRATLDPTLAEPGAEGSLGLDVWRRCRLTIDLGATRAWVETVESGVASS